MQAFPRIALIAIVAVIAGLLIWLLASNRLAGDQTSQTETSTVNPIEGEIPDANPSTGTNPFEGSYVNPFE